MDITLYQRYEQRLSRIPAFKEKIDEDELDLALILSRHAPVKEDLTLIRWLQNDLGYSFLPMGHFLDKWRVYDSQYKNWAVVLQTLVLVPLEKRKNSTGLIIGARSYTGSAQWLPFLLETMVRLGYSGSVDLWDTGLEEMEASMADVVLRQHQGFYEGSEKFTWFVNDAFEQKASEQRLASYGSVKDQGSHFVPFFLASEGRRFFSPDGDVFPQWPWKKGQCPCEKCCFQALFPEEISNTLLWFLPGCTPGIWSYSRSVSIKLKTEGHYIPENRTAQAAAILIARSEGLATVEGGISKDQGDFEMENGSLRGPLLAGKKGILSVLPLPAESNQQEQVKNSYEKSIIPELRSPFFPTHVANRYQLPEGDYPELHHTGQEADNFIVYERKRLPVNSFMEYEVDVSSLRKQKNKDPFGRVYFGDRKAREGEMWCWKERKIVSTPHICEPYDVSTFRYEWRGWRSRFRHVKDAKDLCPECDRLISTYVHACPRKLSFKEWTLNQWRVFSERGEMDGITELPVGELSKSKRSFMLPEV